jgi:hypothetical protein
MSQNLEPLATVRIVDPRIDVSRRVYGVERGGDNITQQVYAAISDSQQSIVFNAPAPSPNVFMSRKVYLKCTATVTITLPDAAGVLPAGQNVVNPTQFAFRAYPLASSTQNVSYALNGANITFQSADLIPAFTRINNDYETRKYGAPGVPCFLDNCNNYKEIAAFNNNPLGTVGNSIAESPRGAFPMLFIQNDAGIQVMHKVVLQSFRQL